MKPKVSREVEAGCALGVVSVFLLVNPVTGIPAIVHAVQSQLESYPEGPDRLRRKILVIAAFTLGALGSLTAAILFIYAIMAVK